MSTTLIPTRIVPSARVAPLSPRRVEREFRARVDGGAELRSAGRTRRNPRRLLSGGYAPKHRIDLFDTSYYLTHPRQNDDIRFFVGYVAQAQQARIHARIFYKDMSLVWRSASHYVRSGDEIWIGKGDVQVLADNEDELVISSDESTTDLPLEVQTAFEVANRSRQRIPRDETAVGLVLRRGPYGRIAAYRDFTAPRRRAQANPRNLIHRGRPIARFTRRNDPTSLRFVAGYAPDFSDGILEVSRSTSKLYGGALKRYRVLSTNRKIQYLFMAGRRQVWLAPPQALTTELSSYGVRTVDVRVPDELCIPAFEYHSETDVEGLGQIPEGFRGRLSEHDSSRADTSPWLDRLPVIREFRKRVLKR